MLTNRREKNRCPGCRTDDPGRLNTYCARCRLRQYEDHTGEYCYECIGYPCTRLKCLDKRYTNTGRVCSTTCARYGAGSRGVRRTGEGPLDMPAMRIYPQHAQGSLPALRSDVVRREHHPHHRQLILYLNRISHTCPVPQ